MYSKYVKSLILEVYIINQEVNIIDSMELHLPKIISQKENLRQSIAFVGFGKAVRRFAANGQPFFVGILNRFKHCGLI